MAENRTPRSVTGTEAVPNGGPGRPQEQDPNASAVAAPAGPFFTEGELPVVAVLGGPPATYNGYSPDPTRTPQVCIDDDPRSLGVGKPPSGLRR